ncbi:hypothetical protein [Pedobacter sp. ASV28]|uniref:hypothetical protein n=1 Tax=Pedobacter sp. ASV28 TaxID=2795123 RepID=UPI0018ED49E6|nr:hypothetical protein [Pedobacter sp. ASV28]
MNINALEHKDDLPFYEFTKIYSLPTKSNEQELHGEVSFDKNVDDRIFSSCTLEIQDHIAILRKESGEIKDVFPLHHF